MVQTIFAFLAIIIWCIAIYLINSIIEA